MTRCSTPDQVYCLFIQTLVASGHLWQGWMISYSYSSYLCACVAAGSHERSTNCQRAGSARSSNIRCSSTSYHRRYLLPRRLRRRQRLPQGKQTRTPLPRLPHFTYLLTYLLTYSHCISTQTALFWTNLYRNCWPDSFLHHERGVATHSTAINHGILGIQ